MKINHYLLGLSTAGSVALCSGFESHSTNFLQFSLSLSSTLDYETFTMFFLEFSISLSSPLFSEILSSFNSPLFSEILSSFNSSLASSFSSAFSGDGCFTTTTTFFAQQHLCNCLKIYFRISRISMKRLGKTTTSMKAIIVIKIQMFTDLNALLRFNYVSRVSRTIINERYSISVRWIKQLIMNILLLPKNALVESIGLSFIMTHA